MRLTYWPSRLLGKNRPSISRSLATSKYSQRLFCLLIGLFAPVIVLVLCFVSSLLSTVDKI